MGQNFILSSLRFVPLYLFFFKEHKVLKEFLRPFQWRRLHILISATVRPQMSRPNKACCIVKTKNKNKNKWNITNPNGCKLKNES